MAYNELGDLIFRTVYGHIEVLSAKFVRDPGSQPQGSLLAQYSVISESLQSACDKIVKMVSSTFEPSFRDDLAAAKQMNLIVLFVTLAFFLSTILFVHFVYLSPMNRQRKQAINMLNILPSWVIRRSPEAY